MKFIRKENKKLKKQMELDVIAVVLFGILAFMSWVVPTPIMYFIQLVILIAIIFYYIDYRFNEVILEIRK